MDYIEIKLDKCVCYLTKQEMSRLLQSDISLFKTALGRGKAFTRAQDKKRQYEEKWTSHEGEQLDHIE